MENPGPQTSPGHIPADQQQASLGRRSIYKRTEEKVVPSDNLANVIVYLSALYSQLKEDEQRPAAANTTPEPTRKFLQEKRLSRTVAPLKQPFVEFGQRSDTGPVAGAWNEAPDAAAAGAPRQRTVWLASLAVILLVVCGAAALLSFQAHRATLAQNSVRSARPAHPDLASRPASGPVTDEALKFASLALAAMERGELAKASGLLDEAQSRQMVLPGMDYQGALLALSQQDEEKAELWIDRSIDANEAVPECLYLRANWLASKADYKGAADTLEEAARAAPFSPRYPFFWAECLRRQGSPRLALPQFQQALRCRPSVTDTELILFKIGLARIEVGDDADFQSDLASKLAQEPVSGDTLLLAAASAITRGAYPEASEYLRRAAPATPPAILRVRLRDYVFRTQAEQKDIAPVWTDLMKAAAANSPPQHGRKQLVDPATRSLAEADPAAW